MNLRTDSERKWALEAESKPEIEVKHLHHKDIFKYVISTTNSLWAQHTHSMSTKCLFLLE